MEPNFNFADFYEGNYGSAVRYAKAYIYNEDDAQDIVSDTLLRMMEMGERLDCTMNIRGLFFSMIHNSCLDYLRRQKRYSLVVANLKCSLDSYSDDEFQSICQRELFHLLGKALSNLPTPQQCIFKEIRMEGMSYQEVAERMNLSKRNTEYQLRKATDKLRECMLRIYA